MSDTIIYECPECSGLVADSHPPIERECPYCGTVPPDEEPPRMWTKRGYLR